MDNLSRIAAISIDHGVEVSGRVSNDISPKREMPVKVYRYYAMDRYRFFSWRTAPSMADNSADPHEEDRVAEETQELGNEAPNTSAELEELQHSPQMDESDIAEMSMIAAQIEAAEEFDLTFETVDTSDMQPAEERPKSRRRSKDVSPLFVSERQEIEEFLEEGLNESAMAKQNEKANTSVAEALLGEWGSPMVNTQTSAQRLLHSLERRTVLKEAFAASTPKSRPPLKELTRTSINKRKRSSSPAMENDAPSPTRKRVSSPLAASKNGEQSKTPRKRTSSQSKGSRMTLPEDVLKARNV